LIELLYLREIILIIATALTAYTDMKTGYIYDKITYPLIAIGLVITFYEFNIINFLLQGIWLNSGTIQLGIAALVFGVGYLLYYSGKIGGGDVKLFVGISLMIPLQGIMPFVAYVIVIAGMLSILALSAYYIPKYLAKKPNLKENFSRMILALFIGVAIAFYFLMLMQFEIIPVELIALFAVVVFLGLIFIAFERGIKREFFLKRVSIDALEEDEVIAYEFLGLEERKHFDKYKGIIGEKEIQRLKDEGFKELPVYRNLPKFAPFVFVACIIGIALLNFGIIY
jgi:Flp pilus assembly protein protease CpaA